MLIDKLKESFDKTVMQDSINRSSKKHEYPSMFRNTLSFIVDSMILSVIRIFIIIASTIFINGYRKEFVIKFQTIYGEISSFDISMAFHRNLLLQSKFGKSIILLAVICVLVGMIYHAYMLQTKWCATFGRRISKVYITDQFGNKMTTIRSIIRTILNYLPWFFPLIAYFLWNSYKGVSITLLVISCFWSDAYLFCGKRIAIHDIILKTIPCIGKKE